MTLLTGNSLQNIKYSINIKSTQTILFLVSL